MKKFVSISMALVEALVMSLSASAGKIESPRPSERNAEYYKSRPCSRLTESACRIFARHLIGLGGENRELR